MLKYLIVVVFCCKKYKFLYILCATVRGVGVGAVFNLLICEE
jgi:hypothetical protein